MHELFAFASLSELSGRKDKERCCRDEDAFYEEFGADPPALIVAIGSALSFFVRRWPTRHARKAAHPAARELSTCYQGCGVYTLVVPKAGGVASAIAAGNFPAAESIGGQMNKRIYLLARATKQATTQFPING